MTFTGRRNHGKGHTYYLDGVKVPGVTTLLSGGLPKPALVNWAANTAAAYAIDNWDDLTGLTTSERLKKISKAHEANRNAAAVQGTRVHALADKLANGDQVAVPDELAGYVDACVRFLDDWDVQTILTEAPVFSRRWQYAGTLDMIAGLPCGDQDTKTWLIDFKTNKSGPFGDVAFQLAAYRYAEFFLVDGAERPMPIIDECAVVWLRQDGYELIPFHADQGVWREFLYIAQCAKAATACRDYKGDALTPPVRTP